MKLLLFLCSVRNLKLEYISILKEITEKCSPKLKIPLPFLADGKKIIVRETYFQHFSSFFKDREESNEYFDLALYFEKKIFTVTEKMRKNFFIGAEKVDVQLGCVYTYEDNYIFLDILKALSILGGYAPVINYRFYSLFPSDKEIEVKHLSNISSRYEKEYSLCISSYVPTVTNFARVHIFNTKNRFDYFNENLPTPDTLGVEINFFSPRAKEFSLASLILKEEIYIKYFVENFFEELLLFYKEEGIALY